MTNTWPGVQSWAQAHPLTPHGKDWAGYCEMFVADAGGYSNSFETATLELAHASKLFTQSQLDISEVPAGWLYHWAFIGTKDFGHVAFADGNGRALMASTYLDTAIHTHLGYIHARDYSVRTGHKYLGASPDHGGQLLQGIQTRPLSKPGDPRTYTTEKGDTLIKVAARFHTSWQKLYALNLKAVGKDEDVLAVGLKLRLP